MQFAQIFKKNAVLVAVAGVCFFSSGMVGTAGARIIYVDADADGLNNGTSWQNAYNYVQDALADANTSAKPVQIRVAQGTYKPDQGLAITPGDRAATFQLINGAPLKGAYAGYGEPDPNARDVKLYETTMSGDLSGDDVEVGDPEDLLDEPTRAENSYHVVTGSGTDATAVLDGFTITGGNADGPILGKWPDPDRSLQRGGGIHNRASSPTVKNCRLRGNHAEHAGGGIYNGGASPTVINCSFSGNSSGLGGGMYSDNSSPTVTNCTFSNNSANGGGGIYSRDSSPTLTNCTFRANWAGIQGGGMYNSDSSPMLTSCMFTANWADGLGGGMDNHLSQATLVNCSFRDNSAALLGGGIRNNGASTKLMNCSFSSNSAGYYGGAVENNHSSQTLISCVFAANRANRYGGGLLNLESSVQMANCILAGNWAESGGGMYMAVGSAGPGGGCYINRPCDIRLSNCTFAGNSAVQARTFVCSSFCEEQLPGDVQIANCTLWDGANQIWNDDGSRITIDHSDVQGGWPGEGNIDADPCFADPGHWDPNGTPADANDDFWVHGDYRLLPYSPCIDAGDNNSVPADTTDLDGDGDVNEPIPWDLDGNPRMADGDGDGIPVVDMGAYEAAPYVACCFGVNHLKIAQKGKDLDIKGTFKPIMPVDLTVDDIMLVIDDGEGNVLEVFIPAGSFEGDGKGETQRFKYDSPKKSRPEIKTKLDFGKCRFELKAKKISSVNQIKGTTLGVALYVRNNVGEEVLEVQTKKNHLEYKRKGKVDCCKE